jgi:hypothetical protein
MAALIPDLHEADDLFETLRALDLEPAIKLATYLKTNMEAVSVRNFSDEFFIVTAKSWLPLPDPESLVVLLKGFFAAYWFRMTDEDWLAEAIGVLEAIGEEQPQ